MKGFVRRLAIACMLMAFAPLALAQDAAVERLRIHGSNTLGAQLVPALVESWLRSIGYEDVRRAQAGRARTEVRAHREGAPLVVEIDRRGSASGMHDLIEGRAEIAMMSRDPSAQEREDGWQLGDLGSAEQEFVVALDGIAVLVQAANPVRQLSIAQLRGVLSGRIRNWRELGGADAPIFVNLGPAGSGSLEFLRQRVMGGEALAAPGLRHARNTWLANTVATGRTAIGVVSLRTKVPAGVRALAISDGGEAIAPSPMQIMSEDYPLMRRMTLYGGQMMGALGRSFALYTIARSGQQAVARAGHLGVMLRPAPQEVPGRAVPREYAELVAQAQRVPLSLRFNYANTLSIFDSRAERDLDRLAAFMRLPQNRRRTAVIVAFSARDGGTTLMATMASNDRADLIANQLQLRGVAVRRARGLGALRPLVAPTAPDARFRNERVEVWLL